MAPMQFSEPEKAAKDYLLSVARHSIENRLKNRVYEPELPEALDELSIPLACFVTLKDKSGALRGCIGTLEAREPLYLSVAHNAVAAAFSDPRFPALSAGEWPSIKLSISILSSPEPMSVTSEEDLLQQLRQGEDGLILQDGGYSSTFLPSVWNELSNKSDFIRHLKLKAGLAPDYWSKSIKFFRYKTFEFAD